MASSNAYRDESLEMFGVLAEVVRHNPKNYCHQLKGARFRELVEWIDRSVPKLSDPFYKTSTKVRWILTGITDFPRCRTCGRAFSDRNVSARDGYPKFCSAKCNLSNGETIGKCNSTRLARYGKSRCDVEKTRRLRYRRNGGKWEKPDSAERRRSTNLERYGVACSLRSEAVVEKSRRTNLAKRGVEYPSQNPACAQKAVRTKTARYGNGRCDPSRFARSMPPSAAAKRRATCMERYGVANGGASRQA